MMVVVVRVVRVVRVVWERLGVPSRGRHRCRRRMRIWGR